MSSQKVIAALDIGSNKIKVAVGIAEDRKNIINVVGIGVSPSTGIHRGMVSDLDDAISNITAALDDAERMSNESIHRVFVGFSGPQIETFDSKGVIAINGNNSEITENDVDRVLDAAKAVSLPSNREILRIIPKKFAVDSQYNVKYPVGMTGIRLEVEAHIITAQISALKNLEKCLYRTGVDIEEIIPSHLACGEAVLDRRQKELGVVLIEIGASSTNMVVYEEGSVIYSAVLPVGGEHVTNDVAIGSRVAIETAEKIKIEYGTCLPADLTDRDEIDLSEISKTDAHTISKKHISQIIEARYHEIFLLVRDALRKIGKDVMLPSGAILCGSAVKLPGMIDLARETLGLPVQIGFPKNVEGLIDKIDDPSYVSVVGLLHFANRYGVPRSIFDFNFGKIFSSTGDFFKKLLP